MARKFALGVAVLVVASPFITAPIAVANDPLPRVPPGFAIHPFATIGGAPTSLAFGPPGSGLENTLFVTDLVAGTVSTIDASAPVGTPPEVFAEGFSSPVGVMVDAGGRVFVADVEGTKDAPFGTRTYGRVTRVEDTDGDGTGETSAVVLKDLPNGRHNTNGMAIGPDGSLYVTNGNSTDDGVEGGAAEVEPWSGSVVRVDPNATDVSLADLTERDALVAEGMRNLYDIAFSPVDPTTLFIPTNGTDDARTDAEAAEDPAMQALEDSDDLLYATDIDDTVTIVDPVTGEEFTEPVIDDFGFPSCLYNEAKRGNLEPYDNPNAAVIAQFGPCPVDTVVRPVSSFGLHVSADGLAFQTSDAWGPAYTNDLFVTEFGNFFGTEVTGHEVIRVELDETGTEVLRQSEFVSGVVPLDAAFGPDGSMFVADLAGVIYRVVKVADVPTGATVTMTGLQFVPPVVAVTQGSSVTWVNDETLGVPHNATAQQSVTRDGVGTGGFATPTFGPGESASVVMQTPGAFRYICTVHPNMQGVVSVVPSGG